MIRLLIATLLCLHATFVVAASTDVDLLAEALETGSFDERGVAAWSQHRFGISTPRWLDSGVTVSTGDAFTLFASGEIDAGMSHQLEPRHVLWYRIGETGRPRNVAFNMESLRADSDGTIYLTMRPLGFYWDDEVGTYPEALLVADVPEPVDLEVVTVRWSDDALSGILALQSEDVAAARSAAAEFARARSLPDGFEYLWYLGRSNVFDAWRDRERRGIHAYTADDSGIVRMPLDLPLTEDATIEFDWLYETLPALGPEVDADSHDYISIAVEFDNGRDITWFWSGSLQPDMSFHCPLPWWDERETHLVLQSGGAELGDWHHHERRIAADYGNAIAGDMPGRIVGVWFIVNSLFGRQPAEAYFAEVVIRSGGQEVRVFDAGAGAGEG